MIFLICGFASCNSKKMSDPLPPEVESYARERTPDAYQRFQNERLRFLELEERKTMLEKELKLIGRSTSEDGTYLQMQAQQASVEIQITQMRIFIENCYLEHKKYLMGFNSNGTPVQPPRDIREAIPIASKPRPSNNRLPPLANTTPAHIDKEINLPRLTLTTFQMHSPDFPQPSPAETSRFSFLGTEGDRCVLQQRFAIQTEDGVVGFPKGTRLRITKVESEFIYHVTDESHEFIVPASIISCSDETRE